MRARSQGTLRAGLWGLMLVLAALDAFAGLYLLGASVSDAWARGDWPAALNAYWSPLYSWLLAPAVVLARQARAWEAPLAHAVNFVVFVGVLAAFECFVRSALAHVADGDSARATRIWAYALLGRAATAMATLQFITPDLLVAGLTFVLAALLCRIAGGDVRRRTFVALGAAAGVGYLAKLVMLVFGLTALALALALARPRRRALGGVALAAATAALIAAPFVTALSVNEGRFTLGDAGRLNYIWSLRAFGADLLPARSLVLQSGGERRPRVIVEAPRAWDLRGPVAGTVPFWYSPTYWNRGDHVSFSAYAQGRVLVEALRALRRLLVPWWPALLGLVILVVAAGRTARRRSGWPLWYLAVFGAVPFVVYLPVHLEARFVSAPLVLIFFVAFVGLRGSSGAVVRVQKAAAWLVLAAVLVPSLALRVGELARDVRERPRASTDITAERLRSLGVRPGDGIAVVGNFYEAHWARIAGVRVVAVVDADEAFDAARTDLAPAPQVAAALAATGARAIVSDRGPAPAVAPGEWTVLHGALYARPLGAP